MSARASAARQRTQILVSCGCNEGACTVKTSHGGGGRMVSERAKKPACGRCLLMALTTQLPHLTAAAEPQCDFRRSRRAGERRRRGPYLHIADARGGDGGFAKSWRKEVG